jgi:hypothetical protein
MRDDAFVDPCVHRRWPEIDVFELKPRLASWREQKEMPERHSNMVGETFGCRLRKTLGEDAFAKASGEGRALSAEQAMALAEVTED